MQRELLFRGIWDEIDEGIGTVRGSELAAADIICHITGDGQTVIYVGTGTGQGDEPAACKSRYGAVQAIAGYDGTIQGIGAIRDFLCCRFSHTVAQVRFGLCQ